MNELQQIIETAFEARATISPASADAKVRAAVQQVIADLDSGKLRVAEKSADSWTTHQWIKKAVLL